VSRVGCATGTTAVAAITAFCTAAIAVCTAAITADFWTIFR
jgi:hypothetical protein